MRMKQMFICILSVLFLFQQLIYPMTDKQFLQKLEKLAFEYFWKEANAHTGVSKDQAVNIYYEIDGSTKGSIAATGFGLTAICIAHSHGWISYDEAYERCQAGLWFFKNYVQGTNGFFYHFIDIDSGQRLDNKTELSSVDTAEFIAGALFAGQYFKGTEIERYADELYRQINWKWMCATNEFVNMAWYPKNDTDPSVYNNTTVKTATGFTWSEWSDYDEGLLLQVLAIGSPTYPPTNSPACWENLDRAYTNDIYGYDMVYARGGNNSIFMHQYPQCWLDLRRLKYSNYNFFTNSCHAALVNKRFSWEENLYNQNVWGLSACNNPYGSYSAYGSPPGANVYNDGTIAPVGPAGSVMFTPEESLASLWYLYNNYQSELFGKYGFASSFNLNENYFDDRVIGIDQGSILLSIDNHLYGMVWDEFMKIKYIQDALNLMDFQPESDLIRPDTISDLKIHGNQLTWTAPGDNTGKVTRYFIRYLDRPITKPADWYEAREISNDLKPLTPGQKEVFIIQDIPKGRYYFTVKSIDKKGNLSLLSGTTEEAEFKKIENQVLQNFPNPFHLQENEKTTLRYSIKEQGYVKIMICTLSGKIIKEWDQGEQNAGYYQIDWDGRNRLDQVIGPGHYIIVLEINNRRISDNNLVVIK